MSKIKKYFEDHHLEFITRDKSHSERKNSFVIRSREEFYKIFLEEGILKGSGQPKCECFFLRESNDETFFIELKGRSANVKKGIEQIIFSIKEIERLVPVDPLKVYAFIIGSSTPKPNSAINNLKREFKQKYKKDIVIRTANRYTHAI